MPDLAPNPVESAASAPAPQTAPRPQRQIPRPAGFQSRTGVQPLSAPTTPTTTPATPAPLPTAPGVSLTPTNAANDLRGQTITPGATADRYAIANQKFQDSVTASQPAYTKALNDATSYAASRGQLGSGQLRTSYGDLANQRNQQLQTAQSGFLTDALNGSIDDAYKNLGIAQQQQQYQTGLQDQTFNQGVTAQQLANATQNQGFNQQLASGQFQNQTQAQQFGQGVTSAQLQAALQGQDFNQQLAAGQFQNATQAQQFGQGLSSAQLQAALQGQQFNQQLQGGQFQNATQAQQFGQGVTAAELQNATQNQLFNQGLASQQLGNATQAQQFGQGVTQAQLQDQLTNSAANRGAQQLNAGSTGNPSDIQLALSQLFGNNAAQASSALSGLIQGTTANNAAQNPQQTQIQQLLQQLLGQGSASTPAPQLPPNYIPAIPDVALNTTNGYYPLGPSQAPVSGQ